MKEPEKKQKILVADDSEMNRLILADMLEEDYEILEAADGVQAVAMLQKYGTEISVVLLDIMMPDMDGFEVLSIMNRCRWIEDIPVIMISAENSPDSIARAYEYGIADYISRPFDETVVYRRVQNTIMLYARQKKLVAMVADQLYEKEKNSNLLILILSHIVEFRNGESGRHVLHIQAITEFLLRRLIRKTNQYQLNNSDIILISTAAALHDIGKIAIPEEVLNKPGRFTPEEFEIMKTHSAIGARMMEELPIHQEEPLVKTAWQICRWHHERYDGRGYPDGLKGEEIPIGAQVVAVADVYDALTSERVYKKAYPHDVALQMILNGECGTFNPLLLECLSESEQELWEELQKSTPGQYSQNEMQSVADAMMNHEELAASERTLRMMDKERSVHEFLMSVSEEIIFQYSVSSAMLTVSPGCARLFGLEEITYDPLHNESICELFDADDVQRVSEAFRNTTPKQPLIEEYCACNIGGNPHRYKIIGKAIWSAEEQAVLQEIVCKLVDCGIRGGE